MTSLASSPSARPARFPRVLVVSHAAFSDSTNTGITLSAFFKPWDPSALAQLFCHSETPSSRICDHYYRITDFDALKSALGRGTCGGGVPRAISPGGELSSVRQRVYEFGRQKYPFTILARDAIWHLARWRSLALEHWLRDFSPELVFLAAGTYQFAYALGRTLAVTRGIPLVIFIGDDVYSIPKWSLSPLLWCQKAMLRRTMRRTFETAACFLSNCDLMGAEYGRTFGIEHAIVPTCCDAIAAAPQMRDQVPLTCSYIGNVLYFDRWTALRQIGEALARINRDGARAVLNIYSTERLSPGMLRRLTIEGTMAFRGSLTQQQIRQVTADSDILVHVESMDAKNRRLTRLSFSTKIPQYLGSGKCILSVGPSEVASVRYLRDQDVALVVTDYGVLEQQLRRLVDDPALRVRYTRKALALAQERHAPGVVADKFISLIRRIANAE